MPVKKAVDAVTDIFDDLFNLEVNVILKPQMTARKMPMSGEAFYDIASQYDAFLVEHGAWLHSVRSQTAAIDGVGLPLSPWSNREDDRLGRLNSRTFQGLAQSAADLIADHGDWLESTGAERKGDDVVLKRIARNSIELAGIIDKEQLGELYMLGDDRWSPISGMDKSSLLTVRKAWEVGTEKVVMQTVAQVDGDIITRIQESRAGPDDQQLHVVHAGLVATSLEHWRFLFATVATLTVGAITSFFGD